MLKKILAEQETHSAAQSDDRLIAGGAEIDPAIVQTRIGIDCDELPVLLVQRLIRCDLRIGAHRRVQLERQLHLHTRHNEQLVDGDLQILEGRRLDRLLDSLHCSVDVDDALLRDFSSVVHHRLGDVATLEETALHSVHVLTEDDEAAFALLVHVKSAATDQDLLAHVTLDVLETTHQNTRINLRGPLPISTLG